MKQFSILILLLFFTAGLFAQGFEGTIKFSRKNYFDQTDYMYTISHGKVKIDEYNQEGKVVGTMLVDLKSKEVIAINHDRKMYMDVEANESAKDLSKCESFKTTEKKDIQGYSCTKWTVKNDDFKTTGEYWVVDQPNYFFFKDLMDALKRKDRIALYFMQIPDNAGYFPIMGKEVGYDGKVKAELITEKMTRKKVSESEFSIPKGYTKFN
ncbi:MAG: DUF4412 domain-containing protein [Flavobacteriales bacterium]|nr:DUF4412 domain-containing protein [Flavobacteriales bacterium]